MAEWNTKTRDDLVRQADGYGLTVTSRMSKRDIWQMIYNHLSDAHRATTPLEDAHAIINESDEEDPPVGRVLSSDAWGSEPVLDDAGILTDDDDDIDVDAIMRRWKDPGDDMIIRPRSLLPSPDEFSGIERIAAVLFGANMIRSGKRLNTQADVVCLLLAARDLGISPTMAIQKIHIIEGRPSLSSELMIALVRNAGHSILPRESTATRATAVGTRIGARAEETAEFTFTIEDAHQAQLANKDNWKHYPKAMLWARAVSGLCRILFPDVLCGLTYTPEELGVDTIDIDSWEAPALVPAPPVAAGPPTHSSAEPADPDEITNLRNRTRVLDDDARDRLAHAWRAANLGSVQINARRPLAASDLLAARALLESVEPDEPLLVANLDPCEEDDLTETPAETQGHRPDIERPGPGAPTASAARAAIAQAREKYEPAPESKCPACGLSMDVDNPACAVHPM